MSLIRTVILTKISSTEKGSYVKGRWVENRNKIETFRGTWQPASGRLLELLPTGKRNRETYVCYAPITMKFTSADPQTGKSGDLIMWENKVYEVTLASKWGNLIASHWELVCVRKTEGFKADFSVECLDNIDTTDGVEYVGQ